jgi:hypothetical protein
MKKSALGLITGIGLVANNNIDINSIVESVHLALEDSKIKIVKANCKNIGIFLGTTFINFSARNSNFNRYIKGGVRIVDPTDVPKGLISYLGGYLAIEFGIKGAISVISSAYSSGIDAMLQGLFFLKRDNNNIAIVADIDERLKNNQPFLMKKVSCLVLENNIFAKRKNNYGHILTIKACFEKKGENKGLSKAITDALCSNALVRLHLDGMFSSSPSNTKRYILEKKALQSVPHICEKPLSGAAYLSHSSLFAIGSFLKDYRPCGSPGHNSNKYAFINLGEDTNSTCVFLAANSRG